MRILWTLFLLAAGGAGLWWYGESKPSLRGKAEQLLNLRSVRALEVRFEVKQIIEAHQKKLLKDKGSHIVESTLKFYPYLLIEAKYTSKQKTKESLLLWDLSDGEMVLRTEDWGKTHGFGDCIKAHVQPHELRILNILSRKGGTCDRKHLLEKLGVEYPVLEAWLRSCYKKNLVLEAGDKYRLHLQNPKLTRVPETEIAERLITRSYKQATRVPKHFSVSQVERLCAMAFGPSFSVRKATEVYLPVYCIVVQLPDGALQTHHINALTGRPLRTALLYE
jgi:hypothetical protein